MMMMICQNKNGRKLVFKFRFILHVSVRLGERTGLMVRASDSGSGDRVGVLFP